MKRLKMVETSSNPDCEVWGIRRPTRPRGTVDWAARVKVAFEVTGPMFVLSKKFWNPMELSWIPTCEGYKKKSAAVLSFVI